MSTSHPALTTFSTEEKIKNIKQSILIDCRFSKNENELSNKEKPIYKIQLDLDYQNPFLSYVLIFFSMFGGYWFQIRSGSSQNSSGGL